MPKVDLPPNDFEQIARELGCDPDDPRVAEVLKAMAAQPPKPHEPRREAKPIPKAKHKNS